METVSRDACNLLDTLSESSRREIFGNKNESFRRFQSLLKGCTGLVLLWSFKAGFAVGVSVGSGFFIKTDASGNWSAPCFIKVSSAKAGVVLGAEKVSSGHQLWLSISKICEALLHSFTHYIYLYELMVDYVVLYCKLSELHICSS